MTRQQKQPDKRRKTKKKKGLAAVVFGAAGRAISRHPSIAGGTAAFVVVFSFVSANAVWYQPGSHPAPFLSTRGDVAERAVVEVPALPVPRQAVPVVQETAAVEADRDDELRSIEDLLTPVPATRVTTTTIRREDQADTADRADQTRTASIPRPSATVDAEPAGDDLIRSLQQELARLELYDGTIDGLDGPRTRAAIEAYGKTAGIGDAVPDEKLLASLRDAGRDAVVRPAERPQEMASVAPARPTTRSDANPNGYVPPVAIPISASGDQAFPAERVMQIQQGLVNIAYSDVTVDGVAGSQTREAIRDFQGHYRLPETGEPTEDVLKKLREIGAL